MLEQVEDLKLWICMSYIGFLIDFLAIKNVFNDSITIFTFLFPILMLFITEVPARICRKINDDLYTFVFTISATILGYTLTMTLSSILYFILIIFVNLTQPIGIFITVILPFIYTLYGVYIMSYTTIETLNFKTNKIKENIKIAHLTDVHLGGVYQRGLVSRIVRILEKMKPDIIVLTGDLADGSMEVRGKWLKPFNKLEVPILFITGNHEEIHGTQSLLNTVKKETKIKYIGSNVYKFKEISFIGVDEEDNLKEKLNKLIPEKINKNEIRILLNHIPQLLPDELKQYDIFLYLSGHTHGGQTPPITFPTYFSNLLFSGLYPSKDNKNFVYVCPGVGAAIVPMRSFCRSVIGEINLIKE